MYKLKLEYVYTFYSFGELLGCEAHSDEVEVAGERRFTLYLQEDGSFVLSELKEDYLGKYVIVTFPGKENLVVHEGEGVELAYEDHFDSMGDDNHNVYEGVLRLERCE